MRPNACASTPLAHSNQIPRKFTSKQLDKMGYEDFVWFILSEEDKTTDTAIDYWFKCADLDCDGVVRPREMWFFYEVRASGRCFGCRGVHHTNSCSTYNAWPVDCSQ